jgi:hypothetical protein
MREWHPQGRVPNRLGRRKTLTPFLLWRGPLVPTGRLNSSIGAGGTTLASLMAFRTDTFSCKIESRFSCQPPTKIPPRKDHLYRTTIYSNGDLGDLAFRRLGKSSPSSYR